MQRGSAASYGGRWEGSSLCEFVTDVARLDLDVVHAFLATSYWATGRDRQTVRRSMAGALCFGLVDDGTTVAFARVVTDQSTFAYLADVFVVPEHRGRGLGTRLVEQVLDDPRVAGVERWLLRTRDAHGLYERFGFEELDAPETWMTRRR